MLDICHVFWLLRLSNTTQREKPENWLCQLPCSWNLGMLTGLHQLAAPLQNCYRKDVVAKEESYRIKFSVSVLQDKRRNAQYLGFVLAVKDFKLLCWGRRYIATGSNSGCRSSEVLMHRWWWSNSLCLLCSGLSAVFSLDRFGASP